VIRGLLPLYSAEVSLLMLFAIFES
jgi:hypothetical protein